jgi:hypothetical protein
MITIGIDNGLTGGLVAISDHRASIIGMSVMPIKGKAKGNEVDAAKACFYSSCNGREKTSP